MRMLDTSGVESGTWIHNDPARKLKGGIYIYIYTLEGRETIEHRCRTLGGYR